MVTDAAVTSRCVLTASVGAGRLTTLVNVCTEAVQQAEARAAGHTAVRSLGVHTLLSWTRQWVLALVDVCAGESSELVSTVTDTPEAAGGVLTASVGATGAACALICVMDSRGWTLCCCRGNRTFSGGGGWAFGRRGDRAAGAGQSVTSCRLRPSSLFWGGSWSGVRGGD